MEVVKAFKKVTGRQLTIELPDSFFAREVEVLVIPYTPMPSVADSDDWKEDFRSISQWEITEEEVKIQSWPIEEF